MAASRAHKMAQEYIASQLSTHGEVQIECYFPDINRTADVASFPLKTVFEIQFSPIHPGEAVERTLDYWKINWNVVWILSSDQFYPELSSTLMYAFMVCGIPYYYCRAVEGGRRSGHKFQLFDLMDVTRKERYEKNLEEIALSSKSLFLPTDRLRKWLSQYRYEKRFPHFYEYQEEEYSLRCDLWPYHLEGDFLSQQQNTTALQPVPRNKRVLHTIRAFIKKRWLQWLVRV